MGRRIPWQLVADAVLLVLLCVLGTLQYRWLNDVSAAERERMRTALNARAADFTDAVDAQVTRLFLTFQRSAIADADPASGIADALARWASEPNAPPIVAAVYLVESRPAGLSIARYDAAAKKLEPCAWPAPLETWKHQAEVLAARPRENARPLPVLLPDAVVPSMPAIILPAPRARLIGGGSRIGYVPDPDAPARSIVVALDAGAIARDILAQLAARYFGDGPSREYVATIVRRDDPDALVFTTPGEPPVGVRDADRVGGLLEPRFDRLPALSDDGAREVTHFAVTIVRSGKFAIDKMAPPAGGGAWQLRLRSVGGSLEAAVARSRRRNLAVGFGVLLLLAASFGLVITSASRQRRLARQQMEFVAAVSHELRTPLAVICSAGENLADGVIAQPEQVKRYGSLVRTEGRRLSAMVERVLAFAGVQSGAAPAPAKPVNVGQVLADATAAARAEAGDRAVDVRVSIPPALPRVSGDADALQSALHNVIGNAVKYSTGDGPVDVAVESGGRTLQIRVTDRGLGIDAADLPHVFKPFFRGRRAADAQVRGSGIGLSIVNQVVAAHGGAVRIDSRPGEGTTVTIELPRDADVAVAPAVPASRSPVSNPR
ncbi:MAG: sensor histidine kinase [Betaproteobacteria bacterium]